MNEASAATPPHRSARFRILGKFLILLAWFLACPALAHASARSGAGSAAHPALGHSGLASKSAEIVRRAYFRPSRPTCANIRDYGGDKTGVLASDAAFDAAIAASEPGHVCLYLPAGTYLFNVAHTISLESAIASASVTIQGDGAEVTTLSFARGTSGLAFVLDHATHSFHLRDLSILGGAYAANTTGIAATQNAVVPNPAYAALSDISGVSVRGADGFAGKAGFGTGISLFKNSNVNFINDYVIGPATAISKCIALAGTNEDIAVVFNLIGTVLNSCAHALDYGPNVQGVSVTSSNMTGNRIGIYTPTGAPNLGQLTVTSSQFANVEYDIDLETDPGGTAISGNYFLANADASPGKARINVAVAKNSSISGNVFQGTSAIDAIVVQAWSAPWSMIIEGNTFNQFATAIWLQPRSEDVLVGINSFNGNKTNILNESDRNIAPAPICSGAPSALFVVRNGIVTHC